MVPQGQTKMVPVDGKTIQSIGYIDGTRELYVKFHGGAPTLVFADIPRFRYSGLMSAPRKDAYYTTYIKSSFLCKEVPSAAQVR